ncbi:rfaE bifunctional protein kinase chain/domain/rfaE bifunctional protein nucleotidyltransferase chain/domain [Motilibacter rhizosphaerae]|uniref:D-glycero-beta-D-manno-heptose 1-phosphate adenylyltransferase n=1 Tax=Motilibacter rhizosphaerae TaxID=598652 RepID=A0A4Q7NWZ6_9ACTN|nr:D-glycero-beta-D-manno-heptose 1-phosphate adenylyltransferase [Motilibacter rhizosphaerae]RZS91530.1 rfaE bifunctional protein kinase chain/domain/rfaE bifunctional protein nucleotidyltransferase chain/domain [Motilibacter rhizosphaerae]
MSLPPEPASPWQELLARFAGRRVAVVGECCLDVWLSGPARGLAREGVVPVVRVEEEAYAPGAGANAARGVAALGAEVRFVSLVGDDEEGGQARALLRAQGVDDALVVTVPVRRTVTKRRLTARGQLMARFDSGDCDAVTGDDEARLVAAVEAAVDGAEVVLAADYACGLWTPATRAAVERAARAAGALLVVDAHDIRTWHDLRPDVVTPDSEEVELVLGPADAEAFARDRVGFLERSGGLLRELSGAATVVVTLDRDGALVLPSDAEPWQVPAEPVAAPVGAGAGDAFAAAMVVALAAGAELPDAAQVGCTAASVVVARPGTTACRLPELRARLERHAPLHLGRERLAALVEDYRARGARIVMTNGCFDVLHAGHVAYLDAARRLGDVLLVGVNGDESVRRLKGPDRPVNPVADRVAVLQALSTVDHVVVFDGDSPTDLLRTVRPDVYVKGGDYTEDMLREAPLVRELGGEVRIVDWVEDRSTTALLERVRRSG